MMDRNKLIKKLEVFSTITFWVSSVGGGILLLMGLNACSSASDAVSGLNRYMDVSGALSSLFGFFILIDAILMVVGITTSYIAKAAALCLKEKELPTEEIKEDKQTNASVKLDANERDPLAF